MRHLLAVLVALAGCGDSSAPTPTGASCPPGSTLTYEEFGKPFMEAYCTRCHSSELHGPDRDGAPLYHDFDTLIGMLHVSGHVDEQAAGGPDAINRFMPPSGAGPSDEERYQLGEWIACEKAREDEPDAGVAE